MKKSFFAIEIGPDLQEATRRYSEALLTGDPNRSALRDALFHLTSLGSLRSVTIADGTWRTIQSELVDVGPRKISAQIALSPQDAEVLASALRRTAKRRDAALLAGFLSDAATEGVSVIALAE